MIFPQIVHIHIFTNSPFYILLFHYLFHSFVIIHPLNINPEIQFFILQMRGSKLDRQPIKTLNRGHNKMKSQTNIKLVVKQKVKVKHNDILKIGKKISSKAISKNTQKSHHNSLFNSLQDLPAKKQQLQAYKHTKTEHLIIPHSNQKIQEGMLSIDIKTTNKYSQLPNGQYFGTMYNSKIIKRQPTKKLKGQSKNKSKTKSKISKNSLSRSLGHKIREFRSIERIHSQQSESLKSELSDQEMKRLRKLHSLEKVKLMQEIISIEEKLHANLRSKK